MSAAFEVILEFHAANDSNEPMGETHTFVLADGLLHHLEIAGSAGQSRKPLSVEDAARELSESFDAAELRAAAATMLDLASRLAK